MTTVEKKAPLLSPLMRWFMLAMVLANIAGSMAPLLMPIYLTEMGASIGQVGLVFTITSVAILILQIIGGWISDSIGRLRAIAIGSVGGIIGFIALIIAPTWQWMIVALIIYQIPFALVGPSFNAFIAENSAEENRGRVYGITGTIYQVTGVIGPPLGGLIAGSYGFKPMLLVAGVFYTAAAGLRIWMATTMRSAEEKQSKPMSMSSFKNSMGLVFAMLFGGGIITWIFITDGINDIANQLTNNLQPLYLEQVAGITLQQIGLLGAIFSIAMMIVPMFSGKLSDRYGERVPIFFGFFNYFCRTLDIPVIPAFSRLCSGLGNFWSGSRAAWTRVPGTHFQSGSCQNVGDILGDFLQQRRFHFPCCSLARGEDVGKLGASFAIFCDSNRFSSRPAHHLGQVQTSGKKWGCPGRIRCRLIHVTGLYCRLHESLTPDLCPRTTRTRSKSASSITMALML